MANGVNVPEAQANAAKHAKAQVIVTAHGVVVGEAQTAAVSNSQYV